MGSQLEPWQLVALLGAGVAAGFVNVVAGGGSLLTLPLLIFLGLPETVANGTNRVALLIQNLSAVIRYRREGRLDVGLGLRLAAPAIVGAAFGAWLGVLIDDRSFGWLLGWVMIACAALIAFDPAGLLQRAGSVPRVSALRVWSFGLAIGLYGGLIQAGVGYLILAALCWGMRIDLVSANIMKVFVVFAYTPVALLVFFAGDKVQWWVGLVLAAGMAAGAWLGAAAALRRGERLIRIFLVLAVAASAAKLLVDR